MGKTLLFSCTLLVSSALVFLVEFTCAKMVLPLLGGSPAVWNTCLVFFQGGLLLGYAYAHLAPRWLGVGRHAVVHLGLWLLAGCWLLLMPFDPAGWGTPPGEPIFWLLWLLTVSVGLPFVLLSSCGPLVQRWFAASLPFSGNSEADNPYFLYTASNLGSLLGLVSYPFIVEPRLSLARQSEAWAWIFLGLAGLLAACACRLAMPRTSTPGVRSTSPQGLTTTPEIGWPVRLRWVLLALAPSSLMLSVTSYLTTDIAPIPLLWMLPLALYLGSFVLVFSWHNREIQAKLVRWLPAVLLLLLVVPLAEGTEPILLVMTLHLLGFFWIAVVCHGELARSKPPAEHLTEFYLWLAVGGVLGGMLNALAAPLLFRGIVEYPLVLVLAGWLNPREAIVRAGLPGQLETPRSRLDWLAPALVAALTAGLVLGLGRVLPADRFSAALMFSPPAIVCLLAASHPVRFALCLAGLLLASGLYDGVNGKPILRIRSFFGVHRVTEMEQKNGCSLHVLVHGNTIHGMQYVDPHLHNIPLTYYHKEGPIGRFLQELIRKKDRRLDRVGLIGLGTGALACYAQPRQKWTFFEIDPAVIRIAEDPQLFTFLWDHRGQVDVVEGDGRLMLEQTGESFGLIVVDAFGSDSIPLHLLTTQALDIYRQRLWPGGVIAFHISNRYFDLEPVLANLANPAGGPRWTCKIREDLKGDKQSQRFPSTWVLMAESPAHLSDFYATNARGDPNLQPWTDDFSNVLQIMKWKQLE